MRELTVRPEDAGQRFDKYLKRYLKDAPSGFLYKMMRKKNITRNGKKAEGAEILAEGDTVRLYLSEDTLIKFGAPASGTTVSGDPSQSTGSTGSGRKDEKKEQEQKFRVLYHTKDVLIVDKPAGLLTQPDRGGEPALSDLLLPYVRKEGLLTEEDLAHFRPAPANRLDRNTSGIVLCGLTLKGQTALSKFLRARELVKEYLTIVHGHMWEISGDIAYLYKDRKTNTVRVTKETSEGYQLIRTSFYPEAYADSYTLVRVRLHTGKTHQIRARLSSLGFPVYGDPKYSGSGSERIYHGNRKISSGAQMLHAFRVVFPQETDLMPELSGLLVQAALPDRFLSALAECGFSDDNSNRFRNDLISGT